MARESEGGSLSSEVADSQGEATQGAASSETSGSEKTSGYSVVDPGYDLVEPADDELAALKAENTKTKPSEDAAAATDDASETESVESDDDTDEVVETPSDEEVPEDTADSEFSDELLDRAVAAGYELSDLREFRSAKALEKELARFERLQQRLQGKKPAESESAAEQEPESKEPDWDRLIEDGHDPDIIALQKSNWQRAAAAEAKVRQLEAAEQNRSAQAFFDRFDDVLNGLGEQYATIFGKGRRDELTKSSPEAVANRQKVLTTMTILKNGFQQAGGPVPSDEELIHQAVQACYYKQANEFARKELKRKVQNAGSQALSRPRSGSNKELSGQERALAKEREFWKTHS